MTNTGGAGAWFGVSNVPGARYSWNHSGTCPVMSAAADLGTFRTVNANVNIGARTRPTLALGVDWTMCYIAKASPIGQRGLQGTDINFVLGTFCSLPAHAAQLFSGLMMAPSIQHVLQ